MDPLNLLKKYVRDEKLIKHCLATAAIMRGTARKIGEDPELWWKIGILHDIDYEITKGDMSRHGIVGAEILMKENVNPEIAEIVKRHNHTLFGDYNKPVEIALQAADSVSGLIIACALVKGGKISQVTPKTIKKKFKEKSFAAGCDRNRIRLVQRLGLSLEEFFEIAINSLVSIKEDLGLK
ncbi:phosphohydrolase [Archaeoglobales archaeon ex4484_92]|nr:MAG: phosphohydrolase [Archaeoglobales archaeon ex4484_92]